MYALIKNNNIQVGPRSWLYSEFREYLENEGLDASLLTRNAPSTPIITSTYKILPVVINDITYDSLYEQLVGPAYVIDTDLVTGTYSKKNKSIDLIKSSLREKVASVRYEQEISGVDVVINGTTVKCYTTREDRNTYLDAFQLSTDTSVYNFKFPLSNGIFLPLTKGDLLTIVQAVTTHVQSAFSWESNKNEEINNATNVTQLKAISLTYA